jgi:hypothetical protein
MTIMPALRFAPSLTLCAVLAAQTPTAPAPTDAPKAESQAPQDKPPAKLDELRFDHFGTGITVGAPSTKLADVLKAPDQHLGKPMRIEAPITAVCQTKGCWMHLGNHTPPVMVKFKDYAFFVPKDASGRNTIVEGVLEMRQETVEETKHHLEDEGKKDEAAKVTEGRKLFRFMASGVAIEKGKLDEKTYEHFGTGITAGVAALPLAAVLKAPEQHLGKPMRIEAPITAVCQTKGCWMHLGNHTPPVMVKFKDYAFFVPKDASGRETIVEGVLEMRQETVEETKHHLEDEGKKDEAAKVTEGRKLFRFMASGVAIKRAQ